MKITIDYKKYTYELFVVDDIPYEELFTEINRCIEEMKQESPIIG
jgi:hypothetical protein